MQEHMVWRVSTQDGETARYARDDASSCMAVAFCANPEGGTGGGLLLTRLSVIIIVVACIPHRRPGALHKNGSPQQDDGDGYVGSLLLRSAAAWHPKTTLLQRLWTKIERNRATT